MVKAGKVEQAFIKYDFEVASSKAHAQREASIKYRNLYLFYFKLGKLCEISCNAHNDLKYSYYSVRNDPCLEI